MQISKQTMQNLWHHEYLDPCTCAATEPGLLGFGFVDIIRKSTTHISQRFWNRRIAKGNTRRLGRKGSAKGTKRWLAPSRVSQKDIKSLHDFFAIGPIQLQRSTLYELAIKLQSDLHFTIHWSMPQCDQLGDKFRRVKCCRKILPTSQQGGFVKL